MTAFKTIGPATALVLTLLLGLGAPVGAARAQDTREARLAAAHATVDGQIDATYRLEPLLESLNMPGFTPQEQAAVLQAARDLFPGVVQDSKDLVAAAMADAWTLAVLRRPEAITEAQFDALTEVTDPIMHALGARFAYDSITTGCRVSAQPSDFCAYMLEQTRPALP